MAARPLHVSLRAQVCAVTLTDSRKLKKHELESLGVRVADGGHPDWLLEKSWTFIVKIRASLIVSRS